MYTQKISRPDLILQTLLSVEAPSLAVVGRFALRFVGLTATGREITDLKMTMSVRVNHKKVGSGPARNAWPKYHFLQILLITVFARNTTSLIIEIKHHVTNTILLCSFHLAMFTL